ncbi:MAG: hypothetical protein VXW65_12090 [Pseudomonadota bacterium]|nr:hypothetical protein [Pseudomonadota bacterium]
MPSDLTAQQGDLEQPTEAVEPLESPHQHHLNVNRVKLPELLLDNPNIVDCVPESPSQPDVCVHDTDNCNQPARKTVQTPQMG